MLRETAVHHGQVGGCYGGATMSVVWPLGSHAIWRNVWKLALLDELLKMNKLNIVKWK
jgi:hypothetical protein